MSYEAGTAFMAVVPSFAGAITAITAEFTAYGDQAGQVFSDAFNQAAKAGTDGPVGPSDATSAAQGASSGGAFADAFTARVEAALRALPDVAIGADATPADLAIDEIRQKLIELSGKTVGVDISDVEALAAIDAIQADLAQLSADSPSVSVTVDAAAAIAELDAVKGAADAASGDAGGGGGGGLTGVAGGAAVAAGGLTALLHVTHLFTPEIVGLATAVVSAIAGFSVLAIASASTIAAIRSGVTAVDAASKAITAAIPGTTQWSKGIVAMGQAWSGIPANLQSAVSAITTMLSGSSMSSELQSWASNQVQVLTHMFSGSSNAFAPLIYATQRAVQTVESLISGMIGSGGLTNVIGSLSRMVGPATIELVQMGLALAGIAGGFAKAVQDGQGMAVVVRLLQNLAAIVNSGFFAGFIAGWVDFDRLISQAIGLVADALGTFGKLGTAMNGVGTVAGFAASGILAVFAAVFLMGGRAARASTDAATGMDTFSASVHSLATKAAGIGLLAIGFTGLVANVTSLLQISDPLTGIWNGIAAALGFASKAGDGMTSTINGYTVKLSGAIIGTQQMSAAMDLLVRSEQSIGSSLIAAATGFKTFTVTAVDTVATMIANLNTQNVSIAAWAADAQLLIQRGMDPSAVASLAQQAPQDLASMVTATTAQLGQMNVQWQEKMLEATMSGKTGIKGFTDALSQGITNGSPTVKAAAVALATQLGIQLKIPFDGSVKSVQAIGAALNTLPSSVISVLAGKTTQLAAANTDLANKTTKAKTANAGLGTTLLSMVGNLGMTIGGLAMLSGGFKGIGNAVGSAVVAMSKLVIGEDATAAASGILTLSMAALSTVGILVVATGVYELIKHFGVLPGLMIAGAFAVGILTVAMWALDAVPIVALIVAVGLAIVGLIAGIIYLAKHWKTEWKDIRDLTNTTWHAIDNDVLHPLENFFTKTIPHALSVTSGAFTTAFQSIHNIVNTTWHAIDNDFVHPIENFFTKTIPHALDAFVGFFTALPGRVVTALGDFVGTVFAELLTAAKWVNDNVIKPVVAFFKALPGNIVTGLGNIVSTIWSALKKSASWIDTNVLQPVVALFESLPGKIAHIGGDIITAIAGAITGAAGRLASAVANIIPHGTIHVGPVAIPYAQGGIVATPTYGLIGEAGPEAILPLNNPVRMAQILAQIFPSSALTGTVDLSGTASNTSDIVGRLDTQNAILRTLAGDTGRVVAGVMGNVVSGAVDELATVAGATRLR